MSSCLHCKMCEQKPYDSNCEVSSKVIRFAGSPGLWIPLCLFPPSAPMNVSPAVANLKLPSTPSPPFHNTLTSTYISSFNSCRCHKFCCSRKRSESKEDHATYLVSFKQFSLWRLLLYPSRELFFLNLTRVLKRFNNQDTKYLSFFSISN